MALLRNVMAACREGCTCRRHFPPAPSAETVAQRARTLQGHAVTEETKKKISLALTGRTRTLDERIKLRERQYPPRTVEQRQVMSQIAQERQLWKNFRGGAVGDDFARMLEPVGFVREFLVQHGSSRGQSYHLDFAHVDGKVNIELDGPYHFSTPQEDTIRDTWLKSRGWKVIRIKHR